MPSVRTSRLRPPAPFREEQCQDTSDGLALFPFPHLEEAGAVLKLVDLAARVQRPWDGNDDERSIRRVSGAERG